MIYNKENILVYTFQNLLEWDLNEFKSLLFFISASYDCCSNHMGEPAGIGFGFFLVILPIIMSTIFSTIAFIYMARVKGKMLIVSAAILLTFGFILNVFLSFFLCELTISITVPLRDIISNLLNIDTFMGVGTIYMLIHVFIHSFISSVLFGTLGYISRGKNNKISLNGVFTKDDIIILTLMIIIFLLLLVIIFD